MPASRSLSKLHVPGLEAGAILAYAVDPGAKFAKGAPGVPPGNTAAGAPVAELARRADVSERTIKQIGRVGRLFPDLAERITAGELSAKAADALARDRLTVARRWKVCVAIAYEAQGDRARSAALLAPGRAEAADVARWLRAYVAALTDESADLLHARGVTGAAVLGFDPAETPQSIPR